VKQPVSAAGSSRADAAASERTIPAVSGPRLPGVRRASAPVPMQNCRWPVWAGARLPLLRETRSGVLVPSDARLSRRLSDKPWRTAPPCRNLIRASGRSESNQSRQRVDGRQEPSHDAGLGLTRRSVVRFIQRVSFVRQPPREATATDRKHMSVLLARVVFVGGCADHWLAADLRDHECRAVVAVGRLR
jgi:hypothetical protein